MQYMNISRMTAAIYRVGQTILNAKAQKFHLQGGEIDCLYAIILNEGICQTELGELLFISKSATTKLVKNLIAKGYIFRENSLKDKRVYHLYVTEQGKSIAESIQAIFWEQIKLHLKKTNHDEAEKVMKIMEKILGGLLEERKM